MINLLLIPIDYSFIFFSILFALISIVFDLGTSILSVFTGTGAGGALIAGAGCGIAIGCWDCTGSVFLKLGKFILILGTIFPIEYFPNLIQGILKFSPIYVVSYGPAKLFVDFSFDNALSILIAQIIYIIISYLLCLIIYKKGAKRLNVNGG